MLASLQRVKYRDSFTPMVTFRKFIKWLAEKKKKKPAEIQYKYAMHLNARQLVPTLQ